MKTIKRRVVFLLLLAAVFTVLFVSCDLLGGTASISERINLFMEDVNSGDYSVLYTHFMEGETVEYDAIKLDSYWDSTRFAAGSKPADGFSLTTGTPVENSSFTSVPAQLTNDNGTFSVTFNMMADTAGSYYIYQIIDNDNDAFSIRILNLGG